MISSLQYLLGSLSVTALLGLSGAGACLGMSNCGTASIIHCNRSAIVTYSYVSMIMISTIFFYGFILAIIIINKINSQYTISNGIHHLASSLIFGIIGVYSGKSMGSIANTGFKLMAKKPEFYVSFVVCLASVEVTLVIAFLTSLLVIYKVK